ncbi:MAG: hypothetical protein Q9M20_07625 [Mariprofundaceae bacterium]|nr:hypothetical protein [Mariprofundaceae bacterium]
MVDSVDQQDELFNILFQFKQEQVDEKKVPRASRDEISQLATLLKADVTTVKLLFDGQLWLIKENVPLIMAERMQSAFEQSGSQCFIRSVKTEGAKAELQKKDMALLPIFQFPPHEFSPMIYGKPRSVAIHNAARKPLFYALAQSPVAGLFVPFMMSVIFALIIQDQSTSWLSEKFPSSTLTLQIPIFSFFIFASSIYLLFSIFTSKNIICFYWKKKLETPFLSMKKQHWYFKPVVQYQLLNDKLRSVGSIKHKQFSHQCILLDQSGAKLIEISAYVEANDVALDAVLTLREQIFSSWIFDFMQAWLGRSGSRPRQKLFIVRDAQKNIIGKYSVTPKLARLTFDDGIREQFSESQQHLIVAMTLLLRKA